MDVEAWGYPPLRKKGRRNQVGCVNAVKISAEELLTWVSKMIEYWLEIFLRCCISGLFMFGLKLMYSCRIYSSRGEQNHIGIMV